jgi:HD-like signal output (HDOD) protein
MSKHLHSGHVHLAARTVPPMPADCRPIQLSLDPNATQQALQKIGGNLLLPDMPKEIIAIELEMHQTNPNLNRIIQLIETNPAISGEIIGTVSQPTFQRQLVRNIEIHNLTQCVALIGISRTYQLALAVAIKQMATDDELTEKILDHAAKTAYACAEIAGYLPPHDPRISQESAYLFGLYLHGGMLSLAARYPNNYRKVFEQSLTLPEKAHQFELEKAACHATLGVLTGQKWGLDPRNPHDLDLLLAIAHHHNPQAACISQLRVRLLIGVGLLAQSMVSELASSAYQSQEILDQSKRATDMLGLSDEALSNIRRNLNSDWNRAPVVDTGND